MDFFPLGQRPTRRANPNWFTGRVWQTSVCATTDPSRVRATQISFEPGSRSAWHSHPLGQILFVQSGMGLIGHQDGRTCLIRAGDSVWISPGEKHWQGATPDASLELFEIQKAESGYVTTWMSYVSDEEYLAKPTCITELE
ncbi:cupin domain-containing protein [Rhodobacteraceae bacterium M382]|nr:cupin domain-containing protein [Rhodobacteraceae bacterium M382]